MGSAVRLVVTKALSCRCSSGPEIGSALRAHLKRVSGLVLLDRESQEVVNSLQSFFHVR